MGLSVIFDKAGKSFKFHNQQLHIFLKNNRTGCSVFILIIYICIFKIVLGLWLIS